MALPVNLAGLFAKGGNYKRPLFAPNALRLSQIAKDMGCVACVLPGAQAGGVKAVVIGPNGPSAQLTTVTGSPTLDTTEEGPALKFTSSQRVSGATASPRLIDHASISTSYESVVARLKFNSPSAVGVGVYFGQAATAQRGMGVGHDASGNAVALACGSSGPVAILTGSTHTDFVTIGISAGDSAGSGNIYGYENGVPLGSGNVVGTCTVGGAAVGIGLGAAGAAGAQNYKGWVAWAFCFDRALSDAEHWFVAQTPWALLDLANDNLLGETSAAGGTTLTPSLFTNTNSLYSPTLKTTLKPSLFTNTQSFYAPTLKTTLKPSLLTNSQSFYGPTLKVTLKPVALSNSQSFFSPSVNVAGSSLSPSLLTNTQTFYAPKIKTTLKPSALANSQSFYAPKLIAKLAPSLLTNTQSFFAPRLITTLKPSKLTNAQTFYGPKLVLKMSPAALSNAQSFYAPTILASTLLRPGLLTNLQTFYGPSIIGAFRGHGIDYWAIKQAIKSALDTQLAALTPSPLVAVEEEFTPRESWIGIYQDGRSVPDGLQVMAAGTKMRLLVRHVIWVWRYAPDLDKAMALRNSLLGQVEIALMLDRTFGGLCETSWLEGGSFRTVDDPSGKFFAGAEIILTADCFARTT